MAADKSGDVSGPVATITGETRSRRRNRRDLFARQRDEGVLVNRLRHASREQLAVDRERSAGGHASDLGGMHDERVEPPHLFFQQTDGIVQLVSAEGIAADQLGETIRLVDFSRPDRPHFVDGDGNAPAAACQAASHPARPPPMTRIMSGLGQKQRANGIGICYRLPASRYRLFFERCVPHVCAVFLAADQLPARLLRDLFQQERRVALQGRFPRSAVSRA